MAPMPGRRFSRAGRSLAMRKSETAEAPGSSIIGGRELYRNGRRIGGANTARSPQPEMPGTSGRLDQEVVRIELRRVHAQQGDLIVAEVEHQAAADIARAGQHVAEIVDAGHIGQVDAVAGTGSGAKVEDGEIIVALEQVVARPARTGCRRPYPRAEHRHHCRRSARRRRHRPTGSFPRGRPAARRHRRRPQA